MQRILEGGRRAMPPLGPRAWRLLAGVLLFEIGTGMTLPLVIVYLHQQRGISLAASGVALAGGGAGGLLATLVAGPAVDRVGAGRIAVAGLSLAGIGTAGYLVVQATPGAVAASAAQGAGFGATWVAVFPLLIDAVPPSLRGEVLGANYGVTNLGLGIGSLVAGVVLAANPGSFAPLFAADAATYAVFAGWLIRTGELGRRRPTGGDARTRAGYRGVLRNRALLIATGLNLVLVTAGYSQFSAAFPAWATGDAGAPSSLVGFAFAANTWTIAVAQLPMLSVARSRRRTRLVACTGLLFGACWLVVLAAGETSTSWLAYTLLLAAPAVFGLGETLLSPSLPAIVNDLAADQTRGRFIAVYSLGWQVGPMIGPAVAGVALGAGHGVGLLIGLAAACALVAPAAIAYEHVLPPATNRPRAAVAENAATRLQLR